MTEGHARFAELSEDFVGRPGCKKGSMMGFPCLRRDGGYFVSVHKTGESLVIKVSSERVEELIAQGREIYQKAQCAKCHGETGYGDGPSSLTLVESEDSSYSGAQSLERRLTDQIQVGASTP